MYAKLYFDFLCCQVFPPPICYFKCKPQFSRVVGGVRVGQVQGVCGGEVQGVGDLYWSSVSLFRKCFSVYVHGRNFKPILYIYFYLYLISYAVFLSIVHKSNAIG